MVNFKKGNFPQQILNVKGRRTLDSGAIASGMAFLEGQLEKIDPKLREPLSRTWWARDIVAKTGGGFVEYTSAYDVSYATTVGNSNGIMGGETNELPIMQADISKEIYKVFNWGHVLRVPFIDQQKLQKIGRDLESILNNGLKLVYDKTLDINVYEGFAEYGTYGLVNNPNVVTKTAATAADGTTTAWTKKTPDEILSDINGAITATWVNSEYDLSGMANHILIPPEQYSTLVERKVSNDASKSILTYLLENNIGKEQGVTLFIGPCPFLKGAGTGGTDRMMAYVNDEDKVRFSITVPMTRLQVEASVTQLSYLSAFVAQFGQVEFLYLQPVQYIDGI